MKKATQKTITELRNALLEKLNEVESVTGSQRVFQWGWKSDQHFEGSIGLLRPAERSPLYSLFSGTTLTQFFGTEVYYEDVL